MKVQRASYELKFAKLSTEFGEQMAARWYTPEELALVPRFAAGKNKGKMRGIIEWKKVVAGGWGSTPRGAGVQKPGTRDVCIIATVKEMGMTREWRLASRGRSEDERAAADAMKAKRDEMHAALYPWMTSPR